MFPHSGVHSALGSGMSCRSTRLSFWVEFGPTASAAGVLALYLGTGCFLRGQILRLRSPTFVVMLRIL